MSYTDSNPWPEAADGSGSYLQLVDLNSDNSLAVNWIASTQSLSIENILGELQQLFVYPNPVKDFITIQLNSIKNESLKFIVYNLLGQSVGDFELTSNNLQLDLSHLSNGVYYYSIKNKGELILRNKFVKK